MGIFRRRAPEDEFAATVATRLGRMPSVRRVVRRDDFALDIHYGPDQVQVLFLGNLFAETRELEKPDRLAAIDRTIAAVTSTEPPPEDWAQAKPRLRSVIR